MTPFKRNEFQKFYAKMKIRVGGQNNTYTISKDEEFEFDGTMCRYAGMEFSQPGLRGAITAGWASDNADDNSSVQTYSPDRQIAASTSINRDLSRVQRNKPNRMDVGQLDEQTVLNVSDRTNAKANGRFISDSDNHRLASRGIQLSQDDEQDGVAVSRISVPAKLGAVDITKNPNLANKLETISYDSGSGRSTKISAEGVDILMSVGQVNSSVVYDPQGDSGHEVARVRHSSGSTNREGINVTDTSSRRAKPQPAKPQPAVQQPQTKLEEAISIYSDFPSDWNFFAKTDDKLLKLEEYGVSKPMVRALMASESKAFRQIIKTKYPKMI